MTVSPSFTLIRATRPGIFAPTWVTTCGTTYPVDDSSMDACAGETMEICVMSTAVLKSSASIRGRATM